MISMVETTRHQVNTRGQGDVQDLSGLVTRVLGQSVKAAEDAEDRTDGGEQQESTRRRRDR